VRLLHYLEELTFKRFLRPYTRIQVDELLGNILPGNLLLSYYPLQTMKRIYNGPELAGRDTHHEFYYDLGPCGICASSPACVRSYDEAAVRFGDRGDPTLPVSRRLCLEIEFGVADYLSVKSLLNLLRALSIG
jgi:hypothetical protein